MRAPEFWQARGHPLALALAPLGGLYHLAGLIRRVLVRPRRATVPVVCVGNLVAGGAGKTPVALALGAWLQGQGLAVHFLSRGHGGRARGPLRVDPARHGVREVGDEALLLARRAPTWVARNRPAGARAAAAAGAQIIVMDDGFQNPALAKDVSLIVVDVGYGFGNRRLLPAGPLREPVAAGLSRAQALVLLDGGEGEGARATVSGGGLPILAARLVPDDEAMALAGSRVYAFAGIGRPQKFFDTLTEMGCQLAAGRAFPDHHRYAPEEIMEICEEAAAQAARPVTTAKDAVRLPAGAGPMVEVVPVHLEWRDPQALEPLLRGVVARAKAGAPHPSTGAG